MKATDLKEFDHVAVLIDAATAHCALATSMVIGRVYGLTEKAVCIADLEDTNRRVWFPKRALVKGRSEPHGKHFQLAHWFKVDGATARNIDRMVQHSVVSA